MTPETIGVNWYHTRRHILAGPVTEGSRRQPALCGAYVESVDSHAERMKWLGGRRQSVESLPMCKHCERAVTQ